MNSRDRSILAVVVLIVIAVGGYFLLVQPKHNQANSLQAQINTQKSALSNAEAQVQAGLTAETEYKTYLGQLTSIEKAVPSDQQIPELINELQAASTKNHVGFQAVSVSAGASTTGASTTTTTSSTTTPSTSGTSAASLPNQSFSLSFTGSYFSVANLLGTLASFVRADNKHFKASGRLLSISSVSLSQGSGSSSTTAAPTTTAAATSSSSEVTASVTAADYDVPATLLSGSSTGTTAGTPAADLSTP